MPIVFTIINVELDFHHIKKLILTKRKRWNMFSFFPYPFPPPSFLPKGHITVELEGPRD